VALSTYPLGLKNPPDLFFLDDVRAAFPDAVFVWTHRQPHAALASVCDLVSVVRAAGTDRVDRAALGRRQVELWGEAVDRGLAARARLGPQAFVDVWMDDLARDAIGTVDGLYDQIGWPFTHRAEHQMRAWLAGNPRHGRGGHTPDPAEFGLDRAAIEERFAVYIERFGRRDEP
jgi:hypothetical protein